MKMAGLTLGLGLITPTLADLVCDVDEIFHFGRDQNGGWGAIPSLSSHSSPQTPAFPQHHSHSMAFINNATEADDADLSILHCKWVDLHTE